MFWGERERMNRALRASTTLHEIGHDLRQLFSTTFLKKMPTTLDRLVGLTLRSWNPLTQYLGASGGDGIVVTEGAQEGLLPLLQHFPGLQICG